MKRLRIEAEALCRAVAPELNGRPLYVVLASDVYAAPGNGDGPDGCTMRHLDLMLRPTLERLGRWSGRGPAMVLDPRSIGRNAERRIRPARRRVFAPAALGVVSPCRHHNQNPAARDATAGFGGAVVRMIQTGMVAVPATVGERGPAEGPAECPPGRSRVLPGGFSS